MVDTVGYITVFVTFASSIENLFYTSEDDWIQDIEVVVYTPYMAHIIKQSYTKEGEPEKSFDGVRMVKGKSKLDYLNDSLRIINWDELEGVNMEVKQDYSLVGEEDNSEKTTDSSRIMENIKNKTNGGVNN